MIPMAASFEITNYLCSKNFFVSETEEKGKVDSICSKQRKEHATGLIEHFFASHWHAKRMM